MRIYSLLAACAAVSIAAPAYAADKIAPQITFSTGLDYSKGDYGTDSDTKILYLPFTARLATGDFSLSATLPFLQIDGAGDVVGGGDSGPIVTRCSQARQRLGLCTATAPAPVTPATTKTSGIGDISLAAGYILPAAATGDWLVELQARTKLPTASKDKGLGTGKADFGFGIDVSRAFGSVTPFATLGYRVLGDPAEFDLQNGITGSLGASIEAGTSTLLLSYDYSAKSSAASVDSHSLFGSWSLPVTDRLSLTTYGVAGLSKGAPDFALGLQLAVKVDLGS